MNTNGANERPYSSYGVFKKQCTFLMANHVLWDWTKALAYWRSSVDYW